MQLQNKIPNINILPFAPSKAWPQQQTTEDPEPVGGCPQPGWGKGELLAGEKVLAGRVASPVSPIVVVFKVEVLEAKEKCRREGEKTGPNR